MGSVILGSHIFATVSQNVVLVHSVKRFGLSDCPVAPWFA